METKTKFIAMKASVPIYKLPNICMELGTFRASMHIDHEVVEFPTRGSRESTVKKGQLTADSCESPQHHFGDFFRLYLFIY